MKQRHLARLIVTVGLALSATGALAPQLASARPMASHKIYVNKTFHYSITYPGNWSPSPTASVQFIAYSPDKNAFVTANAVKGTLSMSDIKKAQKTALTGLGPLKTKINYALKAIHGVPFELAEALVKNRNGKVLDVILADTDKGGTLYDFNAGVVNGTSVTDKEIVELQNSLNSISISAK